MRTTRTKVRQTAKALRKAITNKETINLNGSEIAVLCRNGFDFSDAVIIQTKGSNRTTKKSKARIEATGAKNFILVLDLDVARGL
jgi:DNA-binding winged helix-turn-helix (wHTH) protein